MKPSMNQKANFLRAEWVEAVSKKGNPYEALGLFFNIDGREFRHLIFNPKSDAEKRYVSEVLRCLCDALDVDYDSIPSVEKDAEHPFKAFAENLIKDLNPREMYVKTIRGKNGFVEIGHTLPIFSSAPDMNYSESEAETVDAREGVVKDDMPF